MRDILRTEALRMRDAEQTAIEESLRNHPTYNPDSCCGSDCCYEWIDDEPCWGDVEVVDDLDDVGWVHACKGHYEKYDGGDYIPSPEEEW